MKQTFTHALAAPWNGTQAAGQAVLEAAGGKVCNTEDNAPLLYGKADRGFRQSRSFIASNVNRLFAIC